MDVEIITYKCDICYKRSRIRKNDSIPICCGKVMKEEKLNEDTESDKNKLNKVYEKIKKDKL